jgi:hypothetical protein
VSQEAPVVSSVTAAPVAQPQCLVSLIKFNYLNFYGSDKQKCDETFKRINQSLTKYCHIEKIYNEWKMKGIDYNKTNQIFDCKNVRYINKCNLHTNYKDIIFVDDNINFINILDQNFESDSENIKHIMETIQIAANVLGPFAILDSKSNKYLPTTKGGSITTLYKKSKDNKEYYEKLYNKYLHKMEKLKN